MDWDPSEPASDATASPLKSLHVVHMTPDMQLPCRACWLRGHFQQSEPGLLLLVTRRVFEPSSTSKAGRAGFQAGWCCLWPSASKHEAPPTDVETVINCFPRSPCWCVSVTLPACQSSHRSTLCCWCQPPARGCMVPSWLREAGAHSLYNRSTVGCGCCYYCAPRSWGDFSVVPGLLRDSCSRVIYTILAETGICFSRPELPTSWHIDLVRVWCRSVRSLLKAYQGLGSRAPCATLGTELAVT